MMEATYGKYVKWSGLACIYPLKAGKSSKGSHEKLTSSSNHSLDDPNRKLLVQKSQFPIFRKATKIVFRKKDAKKW